MSNFDYLIHADWSCNPGNRWQASATRCGGEWQVSSPQQVVIPRELVQGAFRRSWQCQRVLMGFDFPIGWPAAYGERTGFPNFREALASLGAGDWADYFEVGNDLATVCVRRPFYPYTPRRGVRRSALYNGIGLTANELLRGCEHATP